MDVKSLPEKHMYESEESPTRAERFRKFLADHNIETTPLTIETFDTSFGCACRSYPAGAARSACAAAGWRGPDTAAPRLVAKPDMH